MPVNKFYAIRDNVVGHFGGLVQGENDEAIKRQVVFQLLKGETIYSKNPQDFDLYRVMAFDDESGDVKSDFEFICALSALKGGKKK